MIDTLSHAVVQTLCQPLYVPTKLAHVLSILGLKRKHGSLQTLQNEEELLTLKRLCSHLDKKPARELDSDDVSEAGALAD